MAILREQGVNGQIEMAAAFHRAGFEARAVLLHVNASASLWLAGVTAANGRVLAAMPHPERVFRAIQNSWRHERWQEAGPWLRLFRNARIALG